MEIPSEILIKVKKIIIFFDLFDCPLTLFEIYKYLNKELSLEQLTGVLSAHDSDLSQKNGFYYLRGREDIVSTRASRYNYSRRKYKSAHNFIRILKHLPFIKVIALANSIGPHNLRDGSDIDMFIISAPRRIWMTRFVLASMAKLLNRRPTSSNKRDKICLSFYITTNSLCLKNLMLPGGDPYFFYWLRSLVLLYNKDGVYEKFLVANDLVEPQKYSEFSVQNLGHRSPIINFIEIVLKKIQLIIMSPALKQAMNNSTGVVVNDEVLKLYLRDNRQEYAEKYGIKIREIFT